MVSTTEISWAGSSRSTSELGACTEDAVLLNPDILITVDENGKEEIILYLSRNVADQINDKIVLSYLSKTAPSECVFSSKSFNAAHHACTAMVKCSTPKYGKAFSTKDMCHHVAHHIIHNPMLASKLGIDFSPLFFCVMCRSHQALTYTANSSVVGCPCWLD
eukprot:2815152-Ditylum_brightwellii.AAC.1